jgi:hypothetical protein
LVGQNLQRPYARHSEPAVKIWSDPHGDMRTQAEQETTWARGKIERSDRIPR